MDTVEIFEVEAVDDHVVDAFARLIPQLNPESAVPDRAELERMVAARCTRLLLARLPESGRIVGAMALALFEVPTGVRARIEDVIVDEEARGRGAGEALLRAALERAAQAGASTVDLTSHASREAANRLYVRLGFALLETNVYRLSTAGLPGVRDTDTAT